MSFPNYAGFEWSCEHLGFIQEYKKEHSYALSFLNFSAREMYRIALVGFRFLNLFNPFGQDGKLLKKEHILPTLKNRAILLSSSITRLVVGAVQIVGSIALGIINFVGGTLLRIDRCKTFASKEIKALATLDLELDLFEYSYDIDGREDEGFIRSKLRGLNRETRGIALVDADYQTQFFYKSGEQA